MGLADVQVPRPGVWRWEGASPLAGARTHPFLELTDRAGNVRATIWPEGAPVPSLYGLLADMALTLNERDAECPLCRGDAINGGMCGSCRREHQP